MKTQEIIEGNKLIKQFMEIDVFTYGSWKQDQLTEGKYHSSWDWLMPVVLKINTMDNFDYSVKIFTMDCQIENSKGEIIARCECKYNPDELINSVWEAVVEFIKWYNQNN